MREYLDFEKPIAEIEEKIEKLTAAGQERPGVPDDLRKLREKLYKLQAEIYAGLTPWQRTQGARPSDSTSRSSPSSIRPAPIPASAPRSAASPKPSPATSW